MAEALVKSVKKAFDALDYVMRLSRTGGESTLSGIAESLDEKQTTVRNILKTMEASGYLGRHGKFYVPGPKAGDMSRTVNREVLIKIATPLLNQVAANFGESFVLTSIYDGQRAVISRHNGSNEIGVNIGVTEQKSIYSLVTTRIMLAFCNDIERTYFFKVNGFPGEEWPEAQNGKLKRCLNELKAQGYAVEKNSSLQACAFPILDDSGKLIGAIGGYSPTFRVNADTESEMREILLDTVAQIKSQIRNI